jgi:hypothetical protein
VGTGRCPMRLVSLKVTKPRTGSCDWLHRRLTRSPGEPAWGHPPPRFARAEAIQELRGGCRLWRARHFFRESALIDSDDAIISETPNPNASGRAHHRVPTARARTSHARPQAAAPVESNPSTGDDDGEARRRPREKHGAQKRRRPVAQRRREGAAVGSAKLTRERLGRRAVWSTGGRCMPAPAIAPTSAIASANEARVQALNPTTDLRPQYRRSPGMVECSDQPLASRVCRTFVASFRRPSRAHRGERHCLTGLTRASILGR